MNGNGRARHVNGVLLTVIGMLVGIIGTQTWTTFTYSHVPTKSEVLDLIQTRTPYVVERQAIIQRLDTLASIQKDNTGRIESVKAELVEIKLLLARDGKGG